MLSVAKDLKIGKKYPVLGDPSLRLPISLKFLLTKYFPVKLISYYKLKTRFLASLKGILVKKNLGLNGRAKMPYF